MAITRIYSPADLITDATIDLDPSVSHHLIRVLRLKADENLLIFNGDGCEYTATIVDANQKKCVVHIDQQHRCNNESPLHITLLQGISRNDRMDACIQKSTELGVSRIIPFISERTAAHSRGQRTDKKLEHWQRVGISACEQSGRCTLPVIEAASTFQNVITLTNAEDKYILDLDAKSSLREISRPKKDICIIVGPESGFTQNEINLACESGFTPVRFGKRVLRTETAGPAFISAIQTLWGDMG